MKQMIKTVADIVKEPVTLEEAKLHLRLNAETLDSNIATSQSIAPGLHEIASSFSLVGASVDVLGLNALVVLNAGACGSGGSVVAKIQESDDNAEWSDWTGGAFEPVAEANDNTAQEIAYTGTKQYIRVVATVAGAPCSFSADVLVKTGDTTEDAYIESLITSAREYCEAFTRRALATQTIEAYFDRFPITGRLELPRPPLQSVISVKYKDSAGAETTMEANTDYIVDDESNIGAIVLPYGKSRPSFEPYAVNPIRVRYVAGYSESNPIPKSIKRAMLLLIGHWYENREATSRNTSKEIEFAVKALLSIWKCGWF